MSSRRSRNGGPRDTAKDIMLGLAPSGQGPRQPKEGVATPKTAEPVRRPTQSVPPTVVVDRRPDNTAINNLQNQLSQLQRQNQELLAAEQNARRRLEDNQEALRRKVMTSDSGVGVRDLEDVRRNLMGLDGKLMSLNGDLNGMRSALDRQANDLIQINNEMKSRPVLDPSKIANSNQQLDGKIRDLHTQLMQMRQLLDTERSERNRDAKVFNDSIGRLQEIIRQQDQSRNDILNNLAKRGDADKEKLSEEAKRLNDKINLITTEVTRNMGESQSKLKDDLLHRIGTIDVAVRSHMDSVNEFERETKRQSDEVNRRLTTAVDETNKALVVDRAKNKDRFHKVNEALAALEHHLELGNKKMDKIMNAEIQSRKLHEKGLLSKIGDVEERVNSYMTNLNKSIEDVRGGKENVKVPSLDLDALRREMEAISADKNKLSMEGLLKLEEKMTRVQTSLYQDKKNLNQKISTIGDNNQLNKLKQQVGKLDEVQDDMEKTQERIRDKVEKQIPQDLNELSAKADNIKHQLNARIDKEEDERYMAIKELQEAFLNLQSKVPNQTAGGMRRDVEECKVAIKKLAESVTTVKNVLDRKITDEVETRKSEVRRLDDRMK